ncbi:GntR family transcriptional regulator [Ruminococcaceae bacterium OttesenSCG-928-D13]|nr:GntR family transcriptional regulator [Ruminococcaceae bacterium OttesenSCG-928-D13]
MKPEGTVGPNSPLYLQLRELLRNKIENGEYPPGTAIPPAGELAQTYGIHRLSVRSAISALIGEGLLRSVQGKGIFVVGEKLEQNLESMGGFEQNMQARQVKIETRVLSKTWRPAGVVYGEVLKCAPEEPVYYIRQISLLNGEPVSLEEVYVPEALAPGLKDIDLNVFTLYEACEFCGIQTVRGEQSLDITILDPMDARLLNVDPKLGVLAFRCVNYDANDRVVNYTRTYTRGDKSTFSVNYRR